MKPQTHELLTRARQLVQERRFDDAGRTVDAVIAADPNEPKAWLMLAQLALQNSKHAVAGAAATRAVQLAPGDAEAWYVLGRAHKLAGRSDLAIGCYQRALGIDGGTTDVWTSLGIALRSLDRPEEAVAAYRNALALKPDHAFARNNLANALEALDADSPDVAQARVAARAALLARVRELSTEAQNLRNANRLSDAMNVALEALQVAPHASELLMLAAQLCVERGQASRALDYYDRAQEAAPDDPRPVEAARRVAIVGGLVERGRRYCEQIMRLAPNPEAELDASLALPAIQASHTAIQETRRAYAAVLDRALISPSTALNPFGLSALPSFLLTYHGECNRELQQQSARLLLKAMPSLAYRASQCDLPRRPGRIRIGLLSRFFYTHSIGKTTLGLIENFDRERFDVTLIRLTPSPDDALTAHMRVAAARVIEVSTPAGLARARAQIEALELDVLFYQDIGMEQMSYLLSFSRLAPVQCVSFGHPDTTGVPNIDYFVSNTLYENAGSAADYSERLFLLQDLPTLAYYHRPRPGQRDTRASYGLPERGTLYLCPQTLFKMHPDFDTVLHGILMRDPNAYIVLIHGQFEEWTAKLGGRFATTLGSLRERVKFVEQMRPERFLGFLSHGDVMLDSPHFNGMNSSLEGFAVGLPIVTLPAGLQRGRHTLAMYQRMGINEAIARDAVDYVNIAVRLGCDAEFNRGLREQILARNQRLYQDQRVVREFERFFLTTLGDRRTP